MRRAWKCVYAKMRTVWECGYCETEKVWKCVFATERVNGSWNGSTCVTDLLLPVDEKQFFENIFRNVFIYCIK